jgi:hypothetical protein
VTDFHLPANIFVTELGHTKVLDFRREKIANPGEEDIEFATRTLTQSGIVIGTLLYMSPGQLYGGAWIIAPIFSPCGLCSRSEIRWSALPTVQLEQKSRMEQDQSLKVLI